MKLETEGFYWTYSVNAVAMDYAHSAEGYVIWCRNLKPPTIMNYEQWNILDLREVLGDQVLLDSTKIILLRVDMCVCYCGHEGT